MLRNKLRRAPIRYTIQGAAIVWVLGAVAPHPAHAYLDPGSGSMVLQLLLAGFAGLAVGLKVFWRKILSFFGIGKRTKPE